MDDLTKELKRQPTAAEILGKEKEVEGALSEGRRKPEDEEMAQLRKELLREQVSKTKEGGMKPADWRGILGNVRMVAQSIKNNTFSSDPRVDLPIEEVMESVAKEFQTSLAEITAGIMGKSATPMDVKIHEGYEYTFDGKQWNRGKKVQ